MKAKLTKSFVDALEPDYGPDPDKRKRITVWDTELAGFGLTVTPPGSRGGSVKSYIFQYRLGGRGTPTRRVTIGRHGWEWQPGQAREKAAELQRMRRDGVDVFEEIKRRRASEDGAKQAMTLEAENSRRLLFENFRVEFVERYCKDRQASSWRQTEAALTGLDRRFGRQRIDAIERAAISAALDEIKARSPSAAIMAHKALRKMFKWANAETITRWQPMQEMGAPAKARVRKRVLTTSELRAIWQAADRLRAPWGDLYKLIAATGLRITEAGHAPWGEFHAEHKALIIPASRMKRAPSDDRGAFLVPLNDPAFRVLDGMLVELKTRDSARLSKLAERPIFTTDGKKAVNGFTYSKQLIDKEIEAILDAPMPHWTTHDLRRTMATAMQFLAIPPSIIDRMQDHRDKQVTGSAVHYQHWEFADEKHAAAAKWGSFLGAAITGGNDFTKRFDASLAGVG